MKKSARAPEPTMFEKLMLPVHRVPEGMRLHEAFPQLYKNPEFAKLQGREDGDKLVKYIIYCYDRNSELAAEHPNNLGERKDAAAKAAGLRKDGRYWDVPMRDIFEMKDAEIRDAILCYLRLQNHSLWREICVTEQELEDYTRIRMTGIEEKDGDAVAVAQKKHQLKKASEETLKYLDRLKREFYGDNVDLMADDYREQITPENAERLIQEFLDRQANVSKN